MAAAALDGVGRGGRPELRALHQVVGVAEISQQLIHHDAVGLP